MNLPTPARSDDASPWHVPEGWSRTAVLGGGTGAPAGAPPSGPVTGTDDGASPGAADDFPAARLNCLHHCLRDVLWGHGVAAATDQLVQPVGTVFSIDRAFRPWLASPGEQWLTVPEFFGSVRAQWHAAWTVDDLRGRVREEIERGHVPILHAHRWRVPWLSGTDLLPADYHTMMALGCDGRAVLLADRQPTSIDPVPREHRVRWDDLTDTARRGVQVLAYDIGEAAVVDGDRHDVDLHALLSLSCRNLGGRVPQVPGMEHGVAAVELLKSFASAHAAAMLDSKLLRLALRWHLPSCIDKYVVGNRRLFLHFVHRHRYLHPQALSPALCHRVEESATAWAVVGRSLARSARRDGMTEPDVASSLADVADADRRLLAAMTTARDLLGDPPPPARPPAHDTVGAR
ncbi:hypothetical protein [Streptomyces lunalinharesii]|uniref:Butirosin biosynthesis protein H N-terminal domain-containing protein n=1 Tax=Streptomyces lunalinharesii TaxID=333384 RepID=A0ABN3SP36_9ACTN